MNIKKLLYWAALGFALVPSKLALAGAAAHGGSAVVCADNSAQMLDTFEGENVYGLNFVSESGSPADLARAALSKLDTYPVFKALLSTELEGVITHARVLNSQTVNVPTEDVYPIVLREGCNIKTAASYMANEPIILIDRAIWEAMDTRNQAALYLHEAVFKIARDHINATDSVMSRKIAGYLASDSTDLSDVSANIASLKLIPYPAFSNYFQEVPTSPLFNIALNPNGESITFTVYSNGGYADVCTGTYQYVGTSLGLKHWISISGSACTLDEGTPGTGGATVFKVHVIGSPSYINYDTQITIVSTNNPRI